MTKCGTWKKENLCSKGDNSTTVTRTNVLEMMRQFRNAPEDEECVEMSEGLQNLSLTSSKDKGSGPRTSQELSVTPAPPEDVIDSNSSSKPSTPNKKVKKVSQYSSYRYKSETFLLDHAVKKAWCCSLYYERSVRLNFLEQSGRIWILNHGHRNGSPVFGFKNNKCCDENHLMCISLHS